MYRSQAPSVLRKRKGLDEENIVSKMPDGKRRSAMRLPLRTIAARNGCNADGDEENDDSQKETSSKSSGSLEELSRLLNCGSAEAMARYEETIKSILHRPYKCPLKGYALSGLALGGGMDRTRFAKYDPNAEGAMILYSPPEMTADERMRCDKTKMKVHVVVDPHLSDKLRPHQREGVKFMYDCVTGVLIPDMFGCIMADGMGLGKTFQCIALMHTLLEQGPDCEPLIENAILAVPSSLVRNWANEIKKWVGDRLPALVIDGGSKAEIDKNMEYFMKPALHKRRKRPYPVLVISYETLRLHDYALKGGEVGLLMCDEGHRLKNKDNQTYQSLKQINCRKRVLLSGTPIQNDLLEYFSLIDFVNPGILGSNSEFKKRFENPITRGRDASSTDSERQKGIERQRELISIVEKCMIRRTSDILNEYLPQKHEMVVCCGFTDLQKCIYKQFINSKAVIDAMKSSPDSAVNKKGGGKATLQAINFLKKLCNHPYLVQDSVSAGDFGMKNLDDEIKQKIIAKDINPQLSGKLMFLDMLLAHIKSSSSDKVVLVSNYTQSMDMFEKMCQKRMYRFQRLDGSMTVKKRAKIVESFNDPLSQDFIFMLSSKAGGCGLNLIGANRLIMFDPDWNPANDAQAMARCWRDGQKKTCYTYRLLGTGSIEEKIFQRQLSKKALSDSIVDNDEAAINHFSREDLKQLFRLEEGISHTHAGLSCKRCFQGRQTRPPPPTATCISDLKEWNHCHVKTDVPDVPMRFAWDAGVTFAFHQISHEPRKTV